MIKIVIADDHELIRLGLRRLLTDAQDVQIVGEASSGKELLSLLSGNKREVDIVLLDIRMPDVDGFEFMESLKEIAHEFRIIVLSTFSDRHYIKRAFLNGASGYLPKEAPPEELMHAINVVNSGGQYLSPLLSSNLVDILKSGPDGDALSGLSPRECEILQMIIQGHPIKAISARLDLAATTVSTYKKRIFEKYQVTNDAELIIFAYKNGLVPSDQEQEDRG